MQRILSFAAGTLCGLAVGAVAALLLTPYSGENLKLKGKAQADRIAHEVRQAYEDKQYELKAQLDALKSPRLDDF
jgi:gas vesicle protein